MADDHGRFGKRRSGRLKSDPARKARLAAALRENLRRRKAQARGRAAGGDNADRGPAATSKGDRPS
jgi:hypothetical protein